MAATRQSLDALRAADDMCVSELTVRGSLIAEARNYGVNEGRSDAVAQGGFEFDYYLSVDADIAFTVDDVRRLIARDKDIVGAAYLRRGGTGEIVAGTCDADAGQICFLSDEVNGLRKVDWIGAGFTLIKRRVFEATPYPWYRETGINYNRDGEPSVLVVGEDIGFCLNAARVGFEVFCDCDCRVEHLTHEGDSMSKEKAMQSASGFSKKKPRTLAEWRAGKAVELRHQRDAAEREARWQMARVEQLTGAIFILEEEINRAAEFERAESAPVEGAPDDPEEGLKERAAAASAATEKRLAELAAKANGPVAAPPEPADGAT
jgi:hypothetical protein